MTYSLSGGVVAAPTTSLPEAIGGPRNWDYRYCWLRDAALTMRAFTRLGYMEEARAFFAWLLHTTRLTWPRLQVLYDVYGRTDVPESELSHWEGYERSAPGADRQRRERATAARHLRRRALGRPRLREQRRRARGRRAPPALRIRPQRARPVAVPDNGMWEIRGERRHYTMSKVWCWTALRSLLALHERGLVEIRVGAVRAGLRMIERAIESRGFNEALGATSQRSMAATSTRACCSWRPSATRTPTTRACAAPTIASTNDSVATACYTATRLGSTACRRARARSASARFGPWTISSAGATVDAARAVFEHVISFANDVGLFAEEIDPDSGAQLGNFPQAFTHVGLIFSALSLASPEQRRANAL